MVTMQERRAQLVAEHIAPAMKELGLRKAGQRWWSHDETGWCVLEMRSDRYSTSDLVYFWTTVAAWPPGTWEHRRALHPGYGARPESGVRTPLWISRPLPGVPESEGLGDGWAISPHTDLDALAAHVLVVMRAQVAWARNFLGDLEAAIDEMLRPGSVPGLVDAVVTLRHERPEDPRLVDLLEDLTRVWTGDPRPITLRPHLALWRTEAGLPAVELPEFWSPSLRPLHDKDPFATPQERWRAGFGTTFYLPDGTETTTPPPGFLD